MESKTYSVGELAETTGLTVRTLQHYDNIGLVPVSGRTEGGRRYYEEADLIRLEQVVFYKKLGFSLDEIRAKLIEQPDTETLRKLLIDQEYSLLRQMENLHTAFAAIDASLRVMDTGKQPSAHFLLRSLNMLPGDDIWERAPELLTPEQKKLIAPDLSDLESAQSFYRRWKELHLAAAALDYAGVSAEHETAQELAEQWWKLIKMLIGDDKQKWTEFQVFEEANAFTNDNNDLKRAENYINDAFEIFSQNNGITFFEGEYDD